MINIIEKKYFLKNKSWKSKNCGQNWYRKKKFLLFISLLQYPIDWFLFLYSEYTPSASQTPHYRQPNFASDEYFSSKRTTLNFFWQSTVPAFFFFVPFFLSSFPLCSSVLFSNHSTQRTQCKAFSREDKQKTIVVLQLLMKKRLIASVLQQF